MKVGISRPLQCLQYLINKTSLKVLRRWYGLSDGQTNKYSTRSDFSFHCVKNTYQLHQTESATGPPRNFCESRLQAIGHESSCTVNRRICILLIRRLQRCSSYKFVWYLNICKDEPELYERIWKKAVVACLGIASERPSQYCQFNGEYLSETHLVAGAASSFAPFHLHMLHNLPLCLPVWWRMSSDCDSYRMSIVIYLFVYLPRKYLRARAAQVRHYNVGPLLTAPFEPVKSNIKMWVNGVA